MSVAGVETPVMPVRSMERKAGCEEPELMPDQCELLSSQQQRTLSRLIRYSVEYVDHPMFHEKGAARLLFRKPVELLQPGGSSLSAEAERILFLRYNYARYRQARILRSRHRERLTSKRISELLSWSRRAVEVRNQIVEPNMPLVLAMIRRNRLLSLDYNELISEGSLALLRCVDKFDCSRGNKFSTYACRSILKSFARVSLRTSRYRCRFPFCFDPAMEKGDCSDRYHTEAESVCLQEVRKIMRDNRAVLSDVEMKVIQARFLAPGEDSGEGPQTLEQIGNSIGVTKERVRQIQIRALRKLRVTLEDSLQR